MLIYIILFVVILGTKAVDFLHVKEYTKKAIKLYVPMILFILTAGLRSYMVGNDTLNYGNIFLNIDSFFDCFKSLNMVGFNLYCFVIGKLFKNYIFFNLCNSAVICFSLANFLKKHSDDYVSSYICFMGFGIFFNIMNQTREMLAVAILLWGFECVLEKKYKRFILIALAALSFHNVTIVLIAVYSILIFSKRMSPAKAIFLSVCSMGMVIFLEAGIDLFVEMFPYYEVYLNEWVGLYTSNVSIARQLNIAAMFLLEIAGVWLILKRDNFHLVIRDNRKQPDIFLLCLLVLNSYEIVFQILAMKMVILIRVEMLFSIFLPLLIPLLLKKMKNHRRALTGLFYLVMLVYMIQLMRTDGSGVVPYSTAF